jgi:hypothetical protein
MSIICMEDEARIRSWMHEAKPHLALHGRYQSTPYHQTYKEMFEPFVKEEQTRVREQADEMRRTMALLC